MKTRGAPRRDRLVRRLRDILWVTALCVALGCGARAETAGPPTIESLRDRAAERPDDPDALRALALGELFAERGDAARAEQVFVRALAKAPADPRLLYAAGVLALHHGDPSLALDRHLAALDALAAGPPGGRGARGGGDRAGFDAGSRAALAEAVVLAIEDLAATAARFRARAEARIERARERLPMYARLAAGGLLVELSLAAGALDQANERIRAAGCVTSFRAAGPFGPRELLGFDETFPAEAPGPLAAEYDLGPRRGVRPTREHGTRGCTAHVGSPLGVGGTTVVEGKFEADVAGRYALRIETPNAYEARIDGEPLLRVDTRRHHTPRTRLVPVELTAGAHEVEIAITTRHPNPVLEVALVRLDDSERAGDTVLGEREGDARGLGPFLGPHVAATRAFARGEAVRAREILRNVSRERGSPVLLALAGAVSLYDAGAPADVRRDEARRLLRAARARDERAWFPLVQLAQLDLADGRPHDAIPVLERGARRFPKVVAIRLALVEALLARDHDVDARRVAKEAMELAEGACAPIEVALRAADGRGPPERIDALIDALVACDARRDVRFERLLGKRDYDGAAREAERLASFEPVGSETKTEFRALDVARARGDGEALAGHLERLRALLPRNEEVVLGSADLLLAAGRADDAGALLRRAAEREPAAMASLGRVRRAVFDDFPLAAHRLDGGAVVRAFEASGTTYDAPSILVLDYTVVRYFDDGSAVELTHNITKLTSQEAVDAEGEVSVPDGAEVLTLHTLKADGRRIEPDRIEGKDTISLPRLAPGDYVEVEYVRALGPADGFPRGFVSQRFFFQSFEVPFDRSEFVAIVPAAWELVVDPRGTPPPVAEETEGGLHVLRWTARESRPLVREPASVSPTEYLPSVAFGVGATWADVVTGFREKLADRDVIDPSAVRLARRLAGAGSPRERAARIYRWVLRNVENDGDPLGQAAPMLRSRHGNVVRVLHYLFGLAGIESRLLLAKTLVSDATTPVLPDDDTFNALLVSARLGGEDVVLTGGERYTAFGYLPPVLRGQSALVIAPDGGEIVLPAGDVEDDLHDVSATVALSADGSAQVSIVERMHGFVAAQWRSQLESIPAAMLEQQFEEAYASRLLPGATLASLEIEARDDPSVPLVVRYGLNVGSLGRRTGGRWHLPPLAPSQLAASSAPAPTRTTTELLPVSRVSDVRVEIQAPDGARFLTRDLEKNESAASARFSFRTAREEGRLVVTRRLRVPARRIEPAEYPAYAAFARAVDRLEQTEIVVDVP